MQAYGSDRVQQDGDRWILTSARGKGWVARVAKTLTSAEFPGTAVLWDDRYFEVVDIDAPPAGGVRYALEAWRDNNVMRVSDRYDEASEAAREEAYRKSLLRERQRKGATIAGVLTGHLPAIVQNAMANEVGLLPERLTMAAIAGVYVVVAAIALLCVTRVMAQQAIPPAAILIGGYLAIENSIRFLIVWTQARPVGSVIGWIAYALYHAMTGRGPSLFRAEQGFAVPITTPPEDVAIRDAFMMREPLVTLLTPREQQRIAERYEYDYRRHSANVARIILIGAIVGLVSSIHAGRVVVAVVAAALAGEQVVRLIAFKRGPAASTWRFLARPFVRKLL
jgi:hypothetical protein